MAEDNPEDVARKEAIEKVTGAADLLLTRGQIDIYDAERELLVRQFHRDTGEEWFDSKPTQNVAAATAKTNAGGTKMWEYRWSDARDGGETHGPYDGAMMQSWSDAGYFGEAVEFRQVNSADSTQSWDRTVEFT